jgi:hypothetical protein
MPAWVKDLLEEIQSSEFAEVVVVFRTSGGNGLRERSSNPLLLLCTRVDRWLRQGSGALRMVEGTSALGPTPVVQLNAAANGALSERDIKLIRDRRLDLLLDFAGVQASDAHDLARGGTFSTACSHATPTAHRWLQALDVFAQSRSCSELRLPGANARYSTVAPLYFSSAALNEDLACRTTAALLLRWLSDAYSAGQPIEVLRAAAPVSSVKRHSARRSTGLLARWSVRLLREELVRRLFREQWFIAIRHRTADARFQVVSAPRDRFFADPFVVEHAGRNYVLFEEYDFARRKGVISCLEVNAAGGCSPPRVVLERDYHLSYPFVFEFDGDMYMVPETRDARRVECYRATEFPWKWEPESVLIDGISAADATLVEYRGRWWLFAMNAAPHRPPNCELLLFYAHSPFGPWIPHPGNPVVADVRSARPAGAFFLREGQLFRPAQDCSAAYGCGVQINKVDVLSETEYHETPVERLTAELPSNLGTHTWNRNHEFEVVDGRILITRF